MDQVSARSRAVDVIGRCISMYDGWSKLMSKWCNLVCTWIIFRLQIIDREVKSGMDNVEETKRQAELMLDDLLHKV